MKVFIPYPKWDLLRAERKLNKLEKEGQRVRSAHFGLVLETERFEGKPGRYFFTYSFPGEQGMEKEEATLEHLYGAEEIHLFPFAGRLRLWRLEEDCPQARELREKRRKHLHHSYFLCLIFCMFVLAMGVLLLSDMGGALGPAVSLLAGMFCFFDLIGLFMTCGWFKC